MLLYFYLQSEILEIKLSSLSVNGVCDLIDKVESLNSIQAPIYKQAIKENNINGRVLLHCDLQELKKVMEYTLECCIFTFQKEVLSTDIFIFFRYLK